MNFLERDLEDIIFSSDRHKLSERGLCICGKMLRQFRIGNYGIADLVEIERNLHPGCLGITVYELKKNVIGIEAFFQAVSYVKGIKSYIERRKPKLDVVYKIILIGREIDLNGSFCYLPSLICDSYTPGNLTDVSFYTYGYSIDGIVFNSENDYDLSKAEF